MFTPFFTLKVEILIILIHKYANYKYIFPMAKKIKILIFSKDRPLQLAGVIDSLNLRCKDFYNCSCTVLYCATDYKFLYGYLELINQYPNIKFRKEFQFKKDALNELDNSDHICFLVDDNIFVKDFIMTHGKEALNNNKKAIGISLRLGLNTNYCYTLNKAQRIPVMNNYRDNILSYTWIDEDYDFGYPLELSSSMYRTAELVYLLKKIHFNNPNELESWMSTAACAYGPDHPQLLCYRSSRAFSVPVNIVQNIYKNKAGKHHQYTVQNLLDFFEKGYRIDVAAFYQYTPKACHEEIDIEKYLIKP